LISFAKLSVFIGRIKKKHCQKERSAHFHAVAEDAMDLQKHLNAMILKELRQAEVDDIESVSRK